MDHKEPLISNRMQSASPALCSHTIARVIVLPVQTHTGSYWIKSTSCSVFRKLLPWGKKINL